ncbi:hypothetical protein KUV44_17630 [Marinobacter daepoensis]|uniref:ATP synthase protein I n=1 Tax=Marinobacter daepoensis TaxID=262077 RepID=A0ABS3B8U3_9GAMM|nr:hypothetical protein [Marinobacter daepoensis]MBN7768285.1 hypothetical protein [Marinobacter daepoensis]MBY6080965.1 hypothetical protein [Marinobacter daepoensis]
MLSREQAEAASNAVLEPKRQQLADRQERKRQRKELWEIHRQKAAIGLVGFGLAGAVGYYAVGDVFPWCVLGLGIGFALAAICRRLGITVNK